MMTGSQSGGSDRGWGAGTAESSSALAHSPSLCWPGPVRAHWPSSLACPSIATSPFCQRTPGKEVRSGQGFQKLQQEAGATAGLGRVACLAPHPSGSLALTIFTLDWW